MDESGGVLQQLESSGFFPLLLPEFYIFFSFCDDNKGRADRITMLIVLVYILSSDFNAFSFLPKLSPILLLIYFRK